MTPLSVNAEIELATEGEVLAPGVHIAKNLNTFGKDI
jgi:hypothetical protein